MNTPEKQQLMAKIVSKLGRDKAIEAVMAAYNAELVTNRMGRMESNPALTTKYASKDLLLLALQRVAEVCDLTG